MPSEPILRIPVTEVFPSIENGKWAAKAVVGESFPVRATIFREGHDCLGAEAILFSPELKIVDSRKMIDIAPGLDRYEAWLHAEETGAHAFAIRSFSDPYATWCHDASLKIAAEVDVELTLEQGARLMERGALGQALGTTEKFSAPTQNAQEHLLEVARILRDTNASVQERLSAGLSSRTRKIFDIFPLRDFCETTRLYPLQVDRKRALYGSWYEVFPRSYGAYQTDQGEWISGTFKGLEKDLDRISQMGFDVLYLTPIHPIGSAFRKGKNNSLTAAPQDPGSPYGIGSVEGGHDALHPDLGTWEDFDHLVQESKTRGLEVALDLALQCSPDHPWVKENPQWFTKRADGTIAYAENPPKKYQDIYPLNFDNDFEGLYKAIWDVVEKWIEHGVTIFRVDNPHTKPLVFWQKFLSQMRLEHPDIIFLAEAFTRPAMMRTLGAVGFHQSYTYFTWRNTKEELDAYFTEVSHDTDHLMRPAFWPTTHDILTPYMTEGGKNAFASRAVLAATGSPTWGIYSGYELVENEPRPGFEEQNNNEKYEFRPRNWQAAKELGISHLLTRLNNARCAHPCLQQLRGYSTLETTSDDLFAYMKYVSAQTSPTGKADTVIVVVNLNPHHGAEGMVRVDLSKLEINLPHGRFQVRDLLDGQTYNWGDYNYVSLDPNVRTAHVFAVEEL
ncbi:alpha-1,4-glucan--maltose-1-phosphate maltosyltransferase [Actinomycetaceae bacterium TAE3-ERU4]|nr:alpha-1,4-glucan--maltose-1-phosphate maltosyltransferase [Actinomycetaceae bacterium TAE3-ERU4]